MIRLELAIPKPAHGAAAVSIDADQQTRVVRVRFEMGKGQAIEEGGQSLAALRRIHRLDTGRQWAGGGVAA